MLTVVLPAYSRVWEAHSTMGRRGGPEQLTPELREALKKALAQGNFVAPACRSVGLNPATFHSWTARGRKEHDFLQDPNVIPHAKELPYLTFFYEMEEAKASAETALVEAWNKQVGDSWQAARDMLARRYPERWGKTERLKVNVPDDDIDSAIERELAGLATGAEVATLTEPASPQEQHLLAGAIQE